MPIDSATKIAALDLLLDSGPRNVALSTTVPTLDIDNVSTPDEESYSNGVISSWNDASGDPAVATNNGRVDFPIVEEAGGWGTIVAIHIQGLGFYEITPVEIEFGDQAFIEDEDIAVTF